MTTVPELIEQAHALLTSAIQQALDDAEERDELAQTVRDREQTLIAREATIVEQAAEIEQLESLLAECGDEEELPLPMGRWKVVNAANGLSVRSEPVISTPSSANRTGWLNNGDVVEELERQSVGSDDWLRHAAGWSAITYQGVTYLERVGDVEPEEPEPPGYDDTSPFELHPPLGVSWLGVDGPAVGVDGPTDTGDDSDEGWPFRLTRDHVDDPAFLTVTERIEGWCEAFQIHLPGTTPEALDGLMAVPGLRFIPARIRYDFPAGIYVGPWFYWQTVKARVQMAYEKGVRWFVFLNEPNVPHDLAPEGLGESWQDGASCGQWLKTLYGYVRTDMGRVMIGAPPVSPGIPGHEIFREAMYAVMLSDADFICRHNYWTNEAELYEQAAIIKREAAARPGYPVVVGECRNTNEAVTGEQAGRELVKFRDALRDVPVLVTTLWFPVFTSRGPWKPSEVDAAFVSGAQKQIKGE